METLPNPPAEVIIYTDGACDPNPGPGGWAAILIYGEHQKELKGRDPNTTNNRMELQAVIAALSALKQPCRVQLHTDSEYVQRGVTEYLEKWKAKGWVTADKKSVANRDLWEALEGARQRHQIEWQWVKGHAGDPLNERVDQLAVSMIPRSSLPLDDQTALHIFTGVSCLGPAGPGAWAAVLRPGAAASGLFGSGTVELSGREGETSANRLHLLAIAKGLEMAPPGAKVHLYTPSDYAAQGARQWARTWAAQGWRTKEGLAVKHKEVWQAIQAAAQAHAVNWHSLKDEARPAESLRAEGLAQQAAREA
jgi:ribonuclease HI